MKLALLALVLFMQDSTQWRADPAVVSVGDSVWISSVIPLEPDERIRIGALDSTFEGVLLRAPEITRGAEAATIQYVVAPFRLGELSLQTPTIELLTIDGTVRSIPPDAVVFTVASVIPDTDSLPGLRSGFDPIPRRVTRAEPLVFLVLLVVFGSYLWWSLRARRKPRPVAEPELKQSGEIPVDHWATVGETRAVAAIASVRLRSFLAARLGSGNSTAWTTEECLAALEQSEGDLPIRELEELLLALENLSFAPAVAADVIRIAEQVDDLIREVHLEESGTLEVVE